MESESIIPLIRNGYFFLTPLSRGHQNGGFQSPKDSINGRGSHGIDWLGRPRLYV